MKIFTEDDIMEGLLVADKLLNLDQRHTDELEGICQQCAYRIYVFEKEWKNKSLRILKMG